MRRLFSLVLVAAPSVRCATGLRYGHSRSRRQTRTQRGEPVTHTLERVGVRDLAHPQLELAPIASSRLREQPLARPLEREPLVVEQRLDPLDQLEIALPIEPLASGILFGPQELELGLPVAKDVRGHGRDLFDLTDPVVELLGDLGHRYTLSVAVLMRCFSPLLGLNVRTFRAVISMESPVWGLRPRRDALRRIRKCPNPTIFTSSPFSKHRKMMSKTDSTTDADWRLLSPCAATALTRAFLVTVVT